MCATCGCETDHHHHHDHEHHHHEVVSLEARILAKNDELAVKNRAWFVERGIRALNLMSSPGAGKTTLLERTIRERGASRTIAVIEGDQETIRDAERIRAAGARALQINTGAGCHLDAGMVASAIVRLAPEAQSLLFIENVGNLVCPALFDLGELLRVVVASVTEGDDKPLKYPHMFRAASLVVLNKVDLLQHVDFDLGRFSENARKVNPGIQILPTSAVRGDGLRHALEGDHLTAVAALASRGGGLRDVVRVAGAWSLGHALVLLVAGCALLWTGARWPPSVASTLELIASGVLVWLGIDVLRRKKPPSGKPLFTKRAFLVGGLHGVEGSGAVILLALPNLHSTAAAVAWLLAFGLGSIAGMVACSFAVTVPLGMAARHMAGGARALQLVAGTASVVVGALLFAGYMRSIFT